MKTLLPHINEQEEYNISVAVSHPSSYSSLQYALNPNVQGAFKYTPQLSLDRSQEPTSYPTIIPLSSYSSLAGALGPNSVIPAQSIPQSSTGSMTEFRNITPTTSISIHTLLAPEKVSHYSSLAGALGNS